MKKTFCKILFSSVIIITVLLSLSFITNAGIVQSAVISNTAVKAKPGEIIKTTLVLNESSGVSSFNIYLNYNQENLSLLSVKINDGCEGTPVINYQLPGQINIAFSSVSNINKEMPIVDLSFMVDENIGVGSYDIIKLNTSRTANAFKIQGSNSVEIGLDTIFSPFLIYEYGDVDLDGRILSIDATWILRHIVGLTVLSDVQLYYADAYPDGIVDTFDATWILRHTVGYDVQLGNRVNIIFHKMDGSVYVKKSVAFGENLTKLPALPNEEGFANGKWSMSQVSYIEPVLRNIEKEVKIYPIYEQIDSAAMAFYKKRLTDQYYLDPTHVLPETNLRLIENITYQNGKYARIYWGSDKSGIFNATNGAYSQPNYDKEVTLIATIVAYNGETIEAQDYLLFPFLAQGKYPTPTKAEIAFYLKSIIGTSIDYNMLLPQKVTNREVEKKNPYEVRVEWEIIGSDGIKYPVVQLDRITTSQNVNLIATLSFNGIPLEGDGKVYFDNITLTAITEAEIRHSIIQQIAANTGLTLTTGDKLWNDDKVYNTSVQWISKNVTIANIAANTVTVRPTAINGSSLPMEAQVTYISDKGAKTFSIAYTTSVVNENTLLVPGLNIQQALYDALRDAVDINGNLTVEHLKSPTFVYLDLSKYPHITDLSGLTYCKNLRVLNISGLRVERALNEISTLNYLEALIARNCGIDSLTDGGIPVLKTAINLKLLDLSHNNFTSLNSVLAENVMYAKLQEVYLNNNKLTDINALKRAPILYFLAISKNGLTSSDIENFTSFKYLRYLSISDNNITSITPLKDLTNLMELRLHNNQITNVRDLQMLVNMRALYLGGNQISDVTWLNNLRQLQVLYINDNKLTSINNLTALTKLAALNVSCNELQNLNMLSICKTTMKELYAENNEIRSFSFLSGMTNLQKLMLSGNANNIETSLPDNLAALSNLVTLTISGKPLPEGLGFLSSMKKLTRLDVSNCGLPNGSDAYLPVSLQYLDISNNTNLVINSNSIRGIYELDRLIGLYADNMQGNIKPEQLFALMSELKYVSLENCGIESISWLSRFIDLIYVDLAGNPLTRVDLNSMPATLKKNLKYLLLDTEKEANFIDAYYAYNGIGDVPLEVLSLSGSQIVSMIKLPFLDRIRHLDLSNTGITNLNGDNPELAELYSIERYQTVESLDLSGLQAAIAPVENLRNLNTLYAVGTSNDQIFYRENILSLYRLYNKGVNAFLYNKDEAYKPVALREGTEILSELPDISGTVQVAADKILSDNNPALAKTINDFPITWSVSNNVNYEIANNRLSVKSYNNIVDEELLLTAQITVYPDQAPVTRSFIIQTRILRTSTEYLNVVNTGISDYLTRNAAFTYDVQIKSAPTEGFSSNVKPVYSEIRYSYVAKRSDNTNIPYNIVLTLENGHRYIVMDNAPLGAQVTIIVDIGHSEPGNSFVSDANVNRTIEIASRTFTITYHPNGGQVISNVDGSTLNSEQYAEDAKLFEKIRWERLGYLFEGWFSDADLKTPFTKDVMPAENVDIYAKWKAHSYTVTFNPNGGEVEIPIKIVLCDTSYGPLPIPTRLYYDFLGWYTAINSGTKIIETTIASSISSDQTLYAHWQRRTFTLNYNANGGTVNPTSKVVNCGDAYGTMPTPTRDYHNFLGWFTEATNGTQVTASSMADNSTVAKTIYARWELKPVSDYVLRTSMPADAQVVSQKWTHTHTQTSTSSALPNGYYYVSTAYGPWGPWSNWQNTPVYEIRNPYDNSQLLREVRTQNVYKTQYNYWGYKGTNGIYHFCPGTGKYVYGCNFNYIESGWLDYTLPYSTISPSQTCSGGLYSGTSNACWHVGRINVYGKYSSSPTYWWVNEREVYAYTQWSYRDRSATYTYRKDNIEVFTNPIGGNGVSNVVEYVQYRLK